MFLLFFSTFDYVVFCHTQKQQITDRDKRLFVLIPSYTITTTTDSSTIYVYDRPNIVYIIYYIYVVHYYLSIFSLERCTNSRRSINMTESRIILKWGILVAVFCFISVSVSASFQDENKAYLRFCDNQHNGMPADYCFWYPIFSSNEFLSLSYLQKCF